MTDYIRLHIVESVLAQQTRETTPDKNIDAVPLGVSNEHLVQTIPRRKGRIDRLKRPRHLVIRDNAPRTCNRDGLRHQLFGSRHIHQHQPRHHSIKRVPIKTRRATIPDANLHIAQILIGHKPASPADSILAGFDTDHCARWTHPRREQVEAAARSASHIHDPLAR
jgi:hypothetical protein